MVARAVLLKVKAGTKAAQQSTRKPPLSEQLEQLQKESKVNPTLPSLEVNLMQILIHLKAFENQVCP